MQQTVHPALVLVVDSFHTLALGDDLAGLAAVPGERIFFVQLADAPRLSMDVLSWSRHFRNFPGQGDLAARWGLDDAALADLRRHGLLYDSDGDGRFWHLYTDAFRERFFFEVVQRRDSYAGFGAANTSVRAAVQARQHPADTLFL